MPEAPIEASTILDLSNTSSTLIDNLHGIAAKKLYSQEESIKKPEQLDSQVSYPEKIVHVSQFSKNLEEMLENSKAQEVLAEEHKKLEPEDFREIIDDRDYKINRRHRDDDNENMKPRNPRVLNYVVGASALIFAAALIFKLRR